MKRFILAALVVGLVVGADKPKKDDGKKGLDGTWVFVSLREDGREGDEVKGDKLIIKGEDVTYKSKKRDHQGTIKIDAKKKTIDLTPNEKNEKTMKGIYQLKGDELKLCFARPDKDRPKDFTAEKGSGRVLMVLKRAKAE